LALKNTATAKCCQYGKTLE